MKMKKNTFNVFALFVIITCGLRSGLCDVEKVPFHNLELMYLKSHPLKIIGEEDSSATSSTLSRNLSGSSHRSSSTTAIPTAASVPPPTTLQTMHSKASGTEKTAASLPPPTTPRRVHSKGPDIEKSPSFSEWQPTSPKPRESKMHEINKFFETNRLDPEICGTKNTSSQIQKHGDQIRELFLKHAQEDIVKGLVLKGGEHCEDEFVNRKENFQETFKDNLSELSVFDGLPACKLVRLSFTTLSTEFSVDFLQEIIAIENPLHAMHEKNSTHAYHSRQTSQVPYLFVIPERLDEEKDSWCYYFLKFTYRKLPLELIEREKFQHGKFILIGFGIGNRVYVASEASKPIWKSGGALPDLTRLQPDEVLEKLKQIMDQKLKEKLSHVKMGEILTEKLE